MTKIMCMNLWPCCLLRWLLQRLGGGGQVSWVHRDRNEMAVRVSLWLTSFQFVIKWILFVIILCNKWGKWQIRSHLHTWKLKLTLSTDMQSPVRSETEFFPQSVTYLQMTLSSVLYCKEMQTSCSHQCSPPPPIHSLLLIHYVCAFDKVSSSKFVSIKQKPDWVFCLETKNPELYVKALVQL